MGRSGKLRARVVPVASLAASTRDAMWALFARHYDGAERATFERDLAEKRDVILARDGEDGSLQGFSTLAVRRHEHAGRRFVAVFSGDTIVDPAYWGQRALQNAFGAYISRAKLRHPFVPVYWFLVSKGYKTYLLLARNFPDHWPRRTRTTPAWERGALDALSRERFGSSWDPERGLVRAPQKDRLKAGVAPIDEDALANEDVRFFLRANPGWAAGDELACLGRVDAGVWARYLLKQAKRRVTRDARRDAWPAS